MMVGGGMLPETNFTRQEVQRPRPPQVAVMSTPPAWAALRMVTLGSASRRRFSGRTMSGIVMLDTDDTVRAHRPSTISGPVARAGPPRAISRDMSQSELRRDMRQCDPAAT